jgi:hypothetical protein
MIAVSSGPEEEGEKLVFFFKAFPKDVGHKEGHSEKVMPRSNGVLALPRIFVGWLRAFDMRRALLWDLRCNWGFVYDQE